jgi:hypothetical protein
VRRARVGDVRDSRHCLASAALAQMGRDPKQPRSRRECIRAERSPPLKRHNERLRRKIVSALPPHPTRQIPVNSIEVPVKQDPERVRH